MNHLQEVREAGYTILADVIPLDLVNELVEDLARLTHDLAIEPSTNSFEGARTLRIYNLLAYGKLWERVPVFSAVLDVVEGVLDDGCLVSSLSSIAIGPGEAEQPIHADDQLIPLPKPHIPIICNSMWALTDFTEANGGTRIIPGSHTRDHSPQYGTAYDSVPAEMSKGSVLIWDGSLWHGGGANQTNDTRIGIAMNYCAGWIRQQENQQLGLDLKTVSGFSPRLQRLCGFEIYRGLIGHINKQPPSARLFDSRSDNGVVWDN
ncbi:MAG: phytanoyl-CoA dioxygenase family protein [Acidimicrobiales bacterium]